MSATKATLEKIVYLSPVANSKFWSAYSLTHPRFWITRETKEAAKEAAAVALGNHLSEVHYRIKFDDLNTGMESLLGR
jgi:hypothetical protein